MNTQVNRSYPYIVVRDKPEKVECYLTVKPNKRVYMQGISKKRLLQIKKKGLSNRLISQMKRLGNGHHDKPNVASDYYHQIFGASAIVTTV